MVKRWVTLADQRTTSQALLRRALILKLKHHEEDTDDRSKHHGRYFRNAI